MVFTWKENKCRFILIWPNIFLQNSQGSVSAELKTTVRSLHWCFYNAANVDLFFFIIKCDGRGEVLVFSWPVINQVWNNTCLADSLNLGEVTSHECFYVPGSINSTSNSSLIFHLSFNPYTTETTSKHLSSKDISFANEWHCWPLMPAEQKASGCRHQWTLKIPCVCDGKYMGRGVKNWHFRLPSRRGSGFYWQKVSVK